MAKNELMVVENFDLALDNDILTAMTEELGEDAVIPYDRIKIPSGGSTAFEIPGDDPDNPDIAKEIEGIIVYAQNVNAYWKDAYDGASNSPNCSSADGRAGMDFETGEIHNCSTCPYNEFGSGKNGKGKACKNMKRLYILRTGSPLPVILTLPPTSIKAYTEYVGRQIVTKGLRTHLVITRISLKKDTSSDGITYSKAQFSKAGKVPESMNAQLTAYNKELREQSAGYGIDADDYDNPKPDENGFAEVKGDTSAELIFEDAKNNA